LFKESEIGLKKKDYHEGAEQSFLSLSDGGEKEGHRYG